MHKKLPLFLLLFTALLAALPAHACTDHPWYHDTQSADELNALYANMLPPSAYREILPRTLLRAIRLLETRPYVALSPRQAERYTGVPAKNWPKGRTFLLRGLRYANNNSQYVVYAAGGKVMVNFSEMGEVGDPFEAPMVVVLPGAPSEVFVTCSLVM